jgi:hypothetical protein
MSNEKKIAAILELAEHLTDEELVRIIETLAEKHQFRNPPPDWNC